MDDPIKVTSKGKQKIYLIAATLVALSIAFFWWWWIYIYPFESTSDAIIAGSDQLISSVQSGQILEMKVDEGDLIKAGEILFTLDDKLFQIEKQKAAFSLDYAKNQVVLQQIKQELAKEDYKRALKEFEGGVISEESFEHARKNLEMARAMFLSALSLVEVQKASLSFVEKQIELCLVKAQMSGMIAKKWHEQGDVVRSGQSIFSLIDLSDVWISANLEETKIPAIQKGCFVEISIDAYPKVKFEGKVSVIGAAAASQFALIPPNNSSGNFTKIVQRVPLKITMTLPKNSEHLYLRPGMSAEIKIRVR